MWGVSLVAVSKALVLSIEAIGGSGKEVPYGRKKLQQPSSSKKSVGSPSSIANVCGHTVLLILSRQYEA
jgi:hypothetical protein